MDEIVNIEPEVPVFFTRVTAFIVVNMQASFLHGFYDTFGWSILGLASTFLSVLLLMFYLKRSGDYQSKLINIK